MVLEEGGGRKGSRRGGGEERWVGGGGRIEGGGGKSFPVPSRPTLSFALLQSSSKISMFMCVCVSLFPLVSNSAHVINKKKLYSLPNI